MAAEPAAVAVVAAFECGPGCVVAVVVLLAIVDAIGLAALRD